MEKPEILVAARSQVHELVRPFWGSPAPALHSPTDLRPPRSRKATMIMLGSVPVSECANKRCVKLQNHHEDKHGDDCKATATKDELRRRQAIAAIITLMATATAVTKGVC